MQYACNNYMYLAIPKMVFPSKGGKIKIRTSHYLCGNLIARMCSVGPGNSQATCTMDMTTFLMHVIVIFSHYAIILCSISLLFVGGWLSL